MPTPPPKLLLVAYVIPIGGEMFRPVSKRSWSLSVRYPVKVHVINATKKAFGFADLTVGRSKMRLAA